MKKNKLIENKDIMNNTVHRNISWGETVQSDTYFSTPEQVAEKVITLCRLDIYNNTRKRNYVDYRALVCWLLRNKLHMRWTNIAQFFESNGKKMDHANVMHLVKQYPYYKKHNGFLDEIENMMLFKGGLNYDQIDQVHYITNKYNNIKDKYEELTNKPLFNVLANIPKDKENEVAAKLELITKSWQWK
tara:strand:- start:98 stop:661 length:564 start_codon:yes stop_codon:yes gene_type:complete